MKDGMKNAKAMMLMKNVNTSTVPVVTKFALILASGNHDTGHHQQRGALHGGGPPYLHRQHQQGRHCHLHKD
jgi:hypothetical protein